MKIRLFITLLITVVLFFSCNLHAQTSDASSIWIKVYWNGLYDGPLMTFGNRIGNSFGLDSSVQYPSQFREYAVTIWDFFAVYWKKIRSNQFGTYQGVWDRDFRDYLAASQKDTFKLFFFEIHDENFSFKWPDASYLREHCDSLYLTYADTGGIVVINMFEQDTLFLQSPGSRNIENINIYKTGVHLVETGVDESYLPLSISVSQNYPNPFNPTTSIQYAVASRQYISIKIYDVLGREVATLVNEVQDAGLKSVTWNANNIPSGVYFYRLQAGSFIETKKMLLIR
jgi:hypothetical protein